MPQPQPTEAQVLAALRAIRDPDLDQDLVSAGFVKHLAIADGKVSFTIELTTPACPMKREFEGQARAAVARLPGVREVDVRMSSCVRPGGHGGPAGPGGPGGAARPAGMPAPLALPGVKNVIVVASGKGGVGKSTVTVNLAVGLAESGARVGLFDADIYGPSIPRLLGVSERPEALEREGRTLLVPLEAHGIHFLSLGLLLADGQPVIWRGPILHRVVEQFLREVEWGKLDYLLVDLPPGTGDVQLSLAQLVPVTGAVIVSTPQEVALAVVRRGIAMFAQLGVPVLGLVENMSHFVCPGCGAREEIFGAGGAKQEAERLGVPFLGAIPLTRRLRESGDSGTPLLAERGAEGPDVAALREIVGNLAAAVSRKAVASSQ